MAVNPFPKGWKPSRLDQGWDGTFSEKAVSPFWGRVVFASNSVPGWGPVGKPGGLIALRREKDGHVFYFAEGIEPTLSKGQPVWPGRRIGIPRHNPYNGVWGNIEWGRANPAQPTQPYVQLLPSDQRRLSVFVFYRWARSLGLGPATDTSRAGFA